MTTGPPMGCIEDVEGGRKDEGGPGHSETEVAVDGVRVGGVRNGQRKV